MMKNLKSLFAASVAVLLSFGAFAIQKPIAMVSQDKSTLTFTMAPAGSAPLGVTAYYWMNSGDFERDEDGYPKWHAYASDITTVVFASGFGTSAEPQSCRLWFADFAKLKTITDLSNLNTALVTDMASMFENCSSLENLDITSLKTSLVEDMFAMFSGCSRLELLDVRGFDMANVGDMGEMFSGCSWLRRIIGPMKNIDSGADSASMFEGCTALVGGSGTEYDPENIGKEYACVDRADGSTPGYFSRDALAIYDASAKTLTFYYDNVIHPLSAGDASYSVTAEDVAGSLIDRAWSEHANDITEVVFSSSFENYCPLHCGKWFAGFSKLESVTGIEYLDTSMAESMAYMFYNCTALTALDVSGFDTGRVTDMCCMFSSCKKLTALNVSGFDTSFVTDMSSMFYGCKLLSSLGVSQFDTKNVVDMGFMFASCSALTELDLSGFDTSLVTNMGNMFEGCSNLKKIYVLDGFSTDAVELGSDMFSSCGNLVGGNGTAYDSAHTGKEYARIDRAAQPGYLSAAPVAVLSSDGETLTFYADGSSHTGEGPVYSVLEASNRDSSDNPPWYGAAHEDVTKVVFDSSFANYKPKHCGSWFYEFGALTEVVGLESLDTSAAADMQYMFCDCGLLASLDLSSLDTRSVTCMNSMFCDCDNLVTLDLAGFDTSKVTDMQDMFGDCSELVTIYAPNFTLKSGVESQEIFRGCVKLVGGAGTSFADNEYTTAGYAIIDGGDMDPGYFTEPPAKAVLSTDGKTLTFYYDTVAHGGTTYSVVEAEGSSPSVNPPWYGKAHSSVENVVFDSSFAAYRPKHCGCWFYQFENLQTVSGLENLDTARATSLTYMFSECSSLASLDLSGFDTAQVTDMSYMFDSCGSLRTIFTSSKFATDSVTDSDYMFNACTALVGGKGTEYDESKTDATYARTDKTGQKGYFTDVDSSVASIGKYLKLNLEDDLGVAIPSDVSYAAGDKVTVKVEGLAKGLKLVSTPVYEDPLAKKKVIVGYDYTLEGVPTAEVPAVAPMYARINVTYKDKTKGTNGKLELVQCLYLVIAPAKVGTFPATELKADYSVSVQTLWPDVDSTWSFKGWPAGLKYTAKNVLAKDKSVLYPAFTVYGKPTKAGVFTITASHPKLVGKTKYTETETATLTVWGDDGKTDFAWNVTCGADTSIPASDVKSVSGLPTGLKFAKGVISGKPTKPGVYAVTVTTTSGTKYTSLWKSWAGDNPGVLYSVDWESEHYYIRSDASTVTLMQGAAYNWAVTTPTGGKVTVSGLPTGLKFAYDKTEGEWRISGTPSKVENKVATFTTVVNGQTVVERLAFTVLENEFTGTYCLVQNDSAGSSMTAIITMAAGGTSKLILTENARKTTVSSKAIVQTSTEGAVTYTLPANAKLGLGERVAIADLEYGYLFLGPKDGSSTEVGKLYKTIKLPETWTEDVVITAYDKYDADGEGTYGYLYLSATINKKTGIVGVTGKLADGTSIKGTTYLLDFDDETGDALIAPVLVTDKKKRVLSLTIGDKSEHFVRRNGEAAAVKSDIVYGEFNASELKNKKASDLSPAANVCAISVSGSGVVQFTPTAKQLATKLGTGGLLKLTQKDADGVSWTLEMVPCYDGATFWGIATGKKGKTTYTGCTMLCYQP